MIFFRQDMTKVNEFKLENIQLVRECFYSEKVLTKNDLYNRTNLSNGSLVNIIQFLLNKNEIVQIEDAISTGGRKKKQYVLNKNYCHIAEIYLHKKSNYYFYELNIVNLHNELIIYKNKKIKKCNKQVLFSLLDQYLIKYDIKTICISIPGICQNGFIRECDFECFENYDLGSSIKAKYDIPFVIENDTNVAAIGLSNQTKISNLALIYQTKDDYFGCGIIIDNKLYNGFNHSAGELRFLPDKTLAQQRKENKENPCGFLENRIQILRSVLDPECIAYASDIIDVNTINKKTNYYPIEDLDLLIEEGLFQISLRKLGGKEYVR